MKKAILLIMFLIFPVTMSASTTSKGVLEGKIFDAETKLPLVGVNIFIKEIGKGAVTNIEGDYKISELNPGNYVVTYSYVGYQTQTKTDIIINPGRTKTVNLELKATSLEMKTVVVNSGYFNSVESKQLSTINFSSEEIRRAPGSAGDISRILFGLPSVAKINDQKNALIVRGGSPLENGFLVDNIEIPNINHFPTPGSSGGPIGIINVDLIDDVNFSSGGFSPDFGDKLSSVMRIKLREGSKSKFNSKLNLSLSGINAIAEGPLSSNSSYLIALNKSYLDLIFGAIDEGTVIPEYGDLQAKLVFDLSKNNKLTFLDVLSIDYINNKYDNAFEEGNNVYGPAKFLANTAGINWRHIWNGSGYSNTSVSYLFKKNDYAFNETSTKDILLDAEMISSIISVRNKNFFSLNKTNKLEFGFDFKLSKNNSDQVFGDYTNEFGNIVSGKIIDLSKDFLYYGGFLNYQINLTNSLKINLGGRADYSDYSEKFVFSPRISFVNNLDQTSSIQGSFGVFYQNLPELVLLQSGLFKELKTPKAIHYVLGYSKLLNESTKLTVEAYLKDYSNLTIDETRPDVLLADETVSNGVFKSYSSLNDLGKSQAKGIEITIQKKLSDKYYGLLSASYSRSTYKNAEGNEFDRLFDNKINFTLEGGYKPNRNWEFSLRWIYAGGRPYTPFDVEKSVQLSKGVLNNSKINESRMKDYHSLNLRFDRRFLFDNSSLTLYLSIWNAYGQENIAEYYWNEIENVEDKTMQWSTLPVLGVEWEF